MLQKVATDKGGRTQCGFITLVLLRRILMDEIFNEDEELAKIQERKIERAVALSHQNEKSLADVKLEDIRFKLGTDKSLQDQAEDVAGALSIAGALRKEETSQQLIDRKSEELVDKAKSKAAHAKAQALDAETEVQKAEQTLYEAVLQTFGIFKHLPRWLMKIVTVIFSPVYLFFCFIVGTPCALVKIIIENIDGIVCRYDKVGDTVKPKIRVIFWIVLALGIVAAICLTVLKCLNKI